MADFLKTNYVDDVLDTSKNTRRKYNMITNPDGTVSFEDVTAYKQVGDSYGSAILNAQNTDLANIKEDISELNSKKFDKSGGVVNGGISVDDKAFIFSNEEGGNLRIKSPNGHWWEIDARADTVLRIFHSVSNPELAEQEFLLDCSTGKIRSTYYNFATLEELTKSVSSASIVDTSRNINISEWLPLAASYNSQNNAGYVNNGYCNGCLTIDRSNAWSPLHKPMNVGINYTTEMPSDCNRGVREILFFDQNNIIVTIKGFDSSGNTGYWMNTFSTSTWLGWKRIA